MSAIRGTVKNGRIELGVPTDWPDGTEVEIHPLEGTEPRNEAGPLSAEEIACTLAAMDELEPFVLSDEERAAIEAERQARSEWEKSRFIDHGDKLRGIWE